MFVETSLVSTKLWIREQMTDVLVLYYAVSVSPDYQFPNSFQYCTFDIVVVSI